MVRVSIDGFISAPDVSRLAGICAHLNDDLVLPVLGHRQPAFQATCPDQATGTLQIDCTEIPAHKIPKLKAGLEFWMDELELPHTTAHMAGPFLAVEVTFNPYTPKPLDSMEISEPAAEEILLGLLDGQRDNHNDILLNARKALIRIHDLHSDAKSQASLTISTGHISQAEQSDVLSKLEAIAHLAVDNDMPNLRATKIST